MIKTTRNQKFLGRAKKVTVTMDGKTKELKKELYAEMIRFIGEAFSEAEKAKDKEGEAWRNL